MLFNNFLLSNITNLVFKGFVFISYYPVYKTEQKVFNFNPENKNWPLFKAFIASKTYKFFYDYTKKVDFKKAEFEFYRNSRFLLIKTESDDSFHFFNIINIGKECKLSWVTTESSKKGFIKMCGRGFKNFKSDVVIKSLIGKVQKTNYQGPTLLIPNNKIIYQEIKIDNIKILCL